MNDLISRQAAIDALDEIRHALWEIDIPSPTVPEYVEHHEQVQSVWRLLDKKQKELYVLPSEQPERKKGKWIKKEKIDPELPEDSDYRFECSLCGWSDEHNDKMIVPYCWHCGAEMSE